MAKKEHDGLGIAFDSPKTRVDRLIEAGAMIRQALHGETIKPTTHFPVTDQFVEPRIDVAPRLIVGGYGQRLLTGCAQWADVIQLTGVTDDRMGALQIHEPSIEQFERRVQWIRDAAPERFPSIAISVLVQKVVVTSSTSQTRDALRNTSKEFECEGKVLQESAIVLIGTPDEIASKLAMLNERLGVSHAALFAPAAEDFAHVLSLL